MPTIKENLLALRVAIVAHPQKQFDLSYYVTEHPCGTLYCSAGLAATMPFFINQLSDWVKGRGTIPMADILSDNADMWGENPFARLFQAAGDGRYDTLLRQQHGEMSDKELAVARIDMALADWETCYPPDHGGGEE